MVHVQAQGESFRGVMKQSEVKYEELKNVIGQDNKMFYIRECEKSRAHFGTGRHSEQTGGLPLREGNPVDLQQLLRKLSNQTGDLPL